MNLTTFGKMFLFCSAAFGALAYNDLCRENYGSALWLSFCAVVEFRFAIKLPKVRKAI
ncbi:hypothetical protein [Pseudomonas sp. P8_250]|uniref:hypothetical protein n=1 Tax=Pseudomonas sp. P8_250 TaxID=3043446 RepID=UPI002A3698FD|nr:hypothetical protein [Pseudomonas sp. P8_250]MDX9668751.1 hypothetical protein [Pseudomonas sp. P8_250]